MKIEKRFRQSLLSKIDTLIINYQELIVNTTNVPLRALAGLSSNFGL